MRKRSASTDHKGQEGPEPHTALRVLARLLGRQAARHFLADRGKGLAFGGSLIRTEATGYGSVYFANEMLQLRGDDLVGKTCVVSGSGNVAQYTAEKAMEMGAKVVTMSDSSGFVYDRNGIDTEKLEWVKQLKNARRGRIAEYGTLDEITANAQSALGKAFVRALEGGGASN